MYVVVIGGGNVGYYLTKELLTAGHEVVMIEKDGQPRARLPTSWGASSSPTTAARADARPGGRVGRADVVAAVTGDDEDNLVACQVAKMHFNVPGPSPAWNNPKNEHLFRQLAIDDTVQPHTGLWA